MIREVARNVLADSLLWLFWVPFRRMLHLLPLPAAYAVGYGVALAASRALTGTRDEMAEDLAKLLPAPRSPKELRRIAAEAIRLDIQRRIEEMFLGRFSQDNIGSVVSLEGEEHLRKAMANGKGTLILLSHFGSFLMVLPALALRGHAVSQLAGPSELKHHRKIHQLIFAVKAREAAKLPIRLLRADLNLKTAFKALAQNELVAMALDGRVGSSWIKVDFFGRPAFFAPGPVKIAEKTGATILPTFIVWDKWNHHRLIFAEPVQLDGSAGKEASLEANMQRLTTFLEEKIIKHPSHFAMIFHINRKRSEQGIEKSFF